MMLRTEIEQAINRCNAEATSNTPDFILAQYLMDCLAAFDKAVSARDDWYEDADEDEPPSVGEMAGILADEDNPNIREGDDLDGYLETP